MAGDKNKWPPDDFIDHWYGRDKSDDWHPRSRKCSKDFHKPADTGMRVSYCKACDTKLVFENWEWVEIPE